ncbi:MAG: methylated-DNA--[protein]-cysteine S-methyltransferase [Planctomycetota bacterium]|jgi:methylated-DNA-[protein]-cysteine S-methyltransferase
MLKGFAMPPVRYTFFDTTLGTVYAAFTDSGLCRLTFDADEDEFVSELEERFELPVERDDTYIRSLQRDFRGYVAGAKTLWSYDLDLTGMTEFQLKVLDALRRIPHGETRTYKQIAEEIENPDAARAVGGACGANPIPIVIPCHRVIATGGGAGGFGIGIDLKRKLLEIEGVEVNW